MKNGQAVYRGLTYLSDHPKHHFGLAGMTPPYGSKILANAPAIT